MRFVSGARFLGRCDLIERRSHGKLVISVNWTVSEIANFKPESDGDFAVKAKDIMDYLHKKGIDTKACHASVRSDTMLCCSSSEVFRKCVCVCV